MDVAKTLRTYLFYAQHIGQSRFNERINNEGSGMKEDLERVLLLRLNRAVCE